MPSENVLRSIPVTDDLERRFLAEGGSRERHHEIVVIGICALRESDLLLGSDARLHSFFFVFFAAHLTVALSDDRVERLTNLTVPWDQDRNVPAESA